ncbi:MAG: PIN domain-containing protein [Mucilaginibacter sp.]
MEEFIDMGILLPLDQSVIEQTILLRRKYKKLKLGDAIIAATAIIHKLILITRNTKDFTNIKKLKVLNPYNI